MRQHSAPLVLSGDGERAQPSRHLPMGAGGHGLSESFIQNLVHDHPECLPIEEIDPIFINPVSVCIELNTPAGPIDNFLVTASGLPVIVECKLWKNPESRREVVGQILDYAKELSNWTSSDIQREASRRLERKGNVLLELLRENGHEIDEIAFNDALTMNLKRGRFLLLIVGDGIRAGVEAISDYLQGHSGLHFTLGLVEMPIFELPGGERLVTPRVLARTESILREVISLPEGLTVRDASDQTIGPDESPEQRAAREHGNAVRKAFWTDFLAGLKLDDPDQQAPAPALGGHVVFKFGAPGGSSWLTVYRLAKENKVGIFLSGNKQSIGERAMQALEPDAAKIQEELGPTAKVDFSVDRPSIHEDFAVNVLEDPADRAVAIAWLQKRTNDFVNVLRPRIRAALRDLAEE